MTAYISGCAKGNSTLFTFGFYVVNDFGLANSRCCHILCGVSETVMEAQAALEALILEERTGHEKAALLKWFNDFAPTIASGFRSFSHATRR